VITCVLACVSRCSFVVSSSPILICRTGYGLIIIVEMCVKWLAGWASSNGEGRCNHGGLCRVDVLSRQSCKVRVRAVG